MSCSVCFENFTSKLRMNVTCPSCNIQSCRKCFQTHVLSVRDTPHCMQCKRKYDRKFLDIHCSKTFINKELKNHFMNILYDKEKLNLPQTQKNLENRKRFEEIGERYIELLDQADMPGANVQEIDLEIRNLITEWQSISTQKNSVLKYKCPNSKCRGFVTDEFDCGLCNKKFCKKCREELTDEHKCDEDVVNTIQLLDNDSKQCPKCSTFIQKTNGCSQMWCTLCHTTFNWNSGEVESGNIHNPHFLEFKKNQKTRELGDIPCGGCPDMLELQNIGAPMEMCNIKLLINKLWSEVHLSLNINIGVLEHNEDLREKFLQKMISEATFKGFLYARCRRKDKYLEIRELYQTLIDTLGDLLRQYVLDQYRYSELLNLGKKLLNVVNVELTDIRTRYNSIYPKNIDYI